jgi:hypothetical protein
MLPSACRTKSHWCRQICGVDRYLRAMRANGSRCGIRNDGPRVELFLERAWSRQTRICLFGVSNWRKAGGESGRLASPRSMVPRRVPKTSVRPSASSGTGRIFRKIVRSLMAGAGVRYGGGGVPTSTKAGRSRVRMISRCGSIR